VATTAIVAEILIVGLEAGAWLSLLVLTIFGTNWVHLGAVEDWAALVTILVLASAYVLGIVVDRVADSAYRQLEHVLPGRVVDRPASIATMRLTILRQGGDLAKFLDYQRSRARVSRATILNAAIAVPVAAAFIGLRAADARALVAVPVLLAALAVAAERSHRRIEFAYVQRLSDAHRLLTNAPEVRIAAAVPYRREQGRVRFLLVRTRGGKRWTFPKGHRKRKETLAETAAREAREEAGVEGKLDGRRFAEFLYHSGAGGDDRVAAFLLEVRKEELKREGKDEKRDRAWVDVDRGCELFRENRDGAERRYSEELESVLLAAARTLEHD
jgi:8-oxo-dGTP pyrophosphatase MutT (NUDIX family)